MYQNTLNEKWNDVCARVASYESIDQSQFKAVVDRLQPQAMSEGFLLLTTDNSFLKSWVERNFIDAIKQALLDIDGVPSTIVIEIDDSQNNRPSEAREGNKTEGKSSDLDSEKGSQIIKGEDPLVPKEEPNQPETSPLVQDRLDQPLNPLMPNEIAGDQVFSSLTFENFVIGESNRMAYSMAVQVAEMPGSTALNPLFIYGKSGLGKTHLMRAIQNYINDTQPHLRTVYADAEELISGYTDAVAEHDKEKSSYKNFKNKYEETDVLLIDDIQFLQGKKQTLDIVFQIFNKLINQGKQIILSADRAPKNIDIDERYSSRFLQGGTIDIQPPEVETKLAIVRSYIKEYQSTGGNADFTMPEDVQMYIAENSGSNIRELKGAITIVIYHINFSQSKTISISEVTTLLEGHFSGGMSKNLTVEDIQKEVENYYRIKHSDLIGTSRSREIVFPRHIAIYLCKQLLDLTFADIGKKFKRDHTTIMHSVSKVENMLLTNRDVQEEIETLKQLIREL